MPADFTGAFVEWGATGREQALRAWEAWLERPPSSVPAIEFYGQETWEDFRKLAWLPALRAKADPSRKLVWSIPLTVKGTDLAVVAEGAHDDAFTAAASAIAAAQPDAVIRIGWEMNVAGSLWQATGREVAYIRAYRRVAEIFRRASPKFRFDWCPGWGAQAGPADLAYPGDDVVDHVGLDVYDFADGKDAESRWSEDVLKGPFGLEWHRAFSRRHGKTMSYPEWGIGHAGDNPDFVEHMADWLRDHRHEIAYAAYFDVDGAWKTRLTGGAFPASAEAYRRRFSGNRR